MKNIKVLNMDIYITKDYDEMSSKAAKVIADVMDSEKNPVLGLATGGTPVGMYDELIDMNKKDKIDFANTTTFNLDEYYPIDKDNDQSYHYIMNETLFDHVNIDMKNINIPNGQAEDIAKEAEEYDEKVREVGIDIQVLGIGTNGHIAFNEPADSFPTKTEKTALTENTIKDNSRFFDNIEDVPKEAITMGIGTIMNAKKIVLLANGESKSETIKEMILGDVTPKVPASILQFHPDVTIVLDEESAKELLKSL